MPATADWQPTSLEPATIDHLLDEHINNRQPRFQKYWNYYRNPSLQTKTGGAQLRLAQEAGLPLRLRQNAEDSQRERVIENDIAWRVDTFVEFMFGKPVTLHSTHPDPNRAAEIERFLRRIFDLNGGIQLFQNMALLGSVFGHVDLLARYQPDASDDPAAQLAIDLVDAERCTALLNADDYRQLEAFVLHVVQPDSDASSTSWLHRLRTKLKLNHLTDTRNTTEAHATQTLVWTRQAYLRYVESPGWTHSSRRLVETSMNRLGRIPVVHIQNLPLPFAFEGLSDVEPLIPLQNELNTRLSDRANRVTFQSFKMYLGKGIEHFIDRPIGPGQMWQTDNPDASIQEFGGGGLDPSETAHIDEVREALDKTSGVSPVAAGIIRDKVGNLTSENALRITLMGLLAKTNRKRLTYGRGIEELGQLLLQIADIHGLFSNSPEERGLRISWPDPLPQNEQQQLKNARLKLELGVPRKTVLAELGYDEVSLT